MRILWSFWFLFGVTLLCIWSANIISHLTIPHQQLPFKTLNDLLNQNIYKYGLTREDTMSGLYFASASLFPMKDIWSNMKQFDENDDEIVSRLSNKLMMEKVEE